MTAADALFERDRVLDEVVAKLETRGVLSPGMQVVERWARRHVEFSLNQIRRELADVGIDGQFAPGGLIQRAICAGLIVKVREEISTSLATHGKKIGIYRGPSAVPMREAVVVPVQRDVSGRFATPSTSQDALFEVAAS